MNQIARVLTALVRIGDYQDEALREYRRLRGGSVMDNRTIAAERFIDERQYEAMRAVHAARRRREALNGSGAAGEGRLNRLLRALRRFLNPVRAQESRRVPVRIEIHRS